MALIKWDPFAELNALHDQLNQAFNDNFGRVASHAPVTDVYSENEKQLTAEIHLPGFDEDDVNIDCHEGALEISAQHHEKEEDKKQRKYLLRESSSSFYRRIGLPKQADEGHIKATFKDGVLKVVVPFKELPKPKKIAIEGGKKKK